MTDEEKKIQEAQRQGLLATQQQAGAAVENAQTGVADARNAYQTWLDGMQPQMETEAAKAARESREKKARRIGAITDGIITLANMAGAANGATAAKQTSYAAQARQREKEALAERVAAYNRYLTQHNARGQRLAQRYSLAQSGLNQAQTAKYRADQNLMNYDAKTMEAERKAAADAALQAYREEQTKKANERLAFDKEKHKDNMASQAANRAIQRERNAISRSKGNGGSRAPKEYDMHKVNRHWESLPEEERSKYIGRGRAVTDEMKKRAWDNRSSGKNLTPPSRRNNNSKTPPSKRK